MLLYRQQNKHHILLGGTVMHGSTLTRPLWAIPHLRITFLYLALIRPLSPSPPPSPLVVPQNLKTVIFVISPSQREQPTASKAKTRGIVECTALQDAGQTASSDCPRRRSARSGM